MSTTGGIESRWAPDGGEIFFIRGQTVVGVPYTSSGDRFNLGQEQGLFDLPDGYQDYDVATDGRCVVSHPVEQADPEIRFVTNWARELSVIALRN